MSQEQNLPAPVTPINEADYQAIEAAVMETERGRWFLKEYAERNRHANTDEVLRAVTELTEEFKSQQGSTPPIEGLKIGLADMAEAIEKTKREIAQMRSDRTERGRVEQASAELDAIVGHTEEATSEILSAAEAIQEIGFEVREDGEFSEAKLDLLDERATEIFMACSFQDLTGQRISKVVKVLRFLEIRVKAMMDIWGFTDEEIKKTLHTVDIDEEHSVENPPMLGPLLPGQGHDQDSVDDLFDVVDPTDIFDSVVIEDVTAEDDQTDEAEAAEIVQNENSEPTPIVEEEMSSDEDMSSTSAETASSEIDEQAENASQPVALSSDDEEFTFEVAAEDHQETDLSEENLDDELDTAVEMADGDAVDDDGTYEAAADEPEPNEDDEAGESVGEIAAPLLDADEDDLELVVATADDGDIVAKDAEGTESAVADAAPSTTPEETVDHAAGDDEAAKPEEEHKEFASISSVAIETRWASQANVNATPAIDQLRDSDSDSKTRSRLQEELQKWRSDLESERTKTAQDDTSSSDNTEVASADAKESKPAEKSFGRRSGFTIERNLAAGMFAPSDDGALGEVTPADSKSALDTLRAFSEEAMDEAQDADTSSHDAVEENTLIPSMIYGSEAIEADASSSKDSQASSDDPSQDQQPLPRIRRNIKGDENASDLLAQYGDAERHALFGR